MHYSDGTPALVGDIVRGRGYNLPYEIVGPVTKLVPSNGTTCNIRVETRVAKYRQSQHDDGGNTPGGWEFETYEEAGQCDAFTLLVRQGWEQAQSQVQVWVPIGDDLARRSRLTSRFPL